VALQLPGTTDSNPSANRLQDKIRGAIFGAAIGDAFGIRTEFMHYKDIEEQYGRVESFEALPPRRPSSQPILERWNPHGGEWKMPPSGFHPLGIWSQTCGCYTDDTRYRLFAYSCLLDRGGLVTGEEFGKFLLRYRIAVEKGSIEENVPRWKGPELEYSRLLASVETISRLAQERRPFRPGWDGPMGVLFAADPNGAANTGYAMAVAVASALSSSSDLTSIVDNVLKNAGVFGPWESEFKGRLEKLARLAFQGHDVFALREPIYREFLIQYPPFEASFVLEMIPVAISLVVAASGDPKTAVMGAANLGRDADTIASMAGELAGAFSGASSIPKDWIDKVNRLNPAPDLEQLSSGMTRLVVKKADEHQNIARSIQTLLEEAAG
jgi:hypothetical protein